MRNPGPYAARGRRSSPSRLSGFEWSLPGPQHKVRSASFGQTPSRRTPHRGTRPAEPRYGRCACVACGLGLLLLLLLVSRLTPWDTVVRQGAALLVDTKLSTFRGNGTSGGSLAPPEPDDAVPSDLASSSVGDETSKVQGRQAALDGTGGALAGAWHRVQAARGGKPGLPEELGDTGDHAAGADGAGSDTATGDQSFFPEDEKGAQKPEDTAMAEGDTVARDADDGRGARQKRRQQVWRTHTKGQVSVGSGLGNKGQLDNILGALDSVRQLSPSLAAKGHGAVRKHRRTYDEEQPQGAEDTAYASDETLHRVAGRHRRLGHAADEGAEDSTSDQALSRHSALAGTTEATGALLAHQSRKRGGTRVESVQDLPADGADNVATDGGAEARGREGALRRTGSRHRSHDDDPEAEVDALLKALENEQTTRAMARHGVYVVTASSAKSGRLAASTDAVLGSGSHAAGARDGDDWDSRVRSTKASRIRLRGEGDGESSEQSAKALRTTRRSEDVLEGRDQGAKALHTRLRDGEADGGSTEQSVEASRTRLRSEHEAYEQDQEDAAGRDRHIDTVQETREAGLSSRSISASAVGPGRDAFGSRVQGSIAAEKGASVTSGLGSRLRKSSVGSSQGARYGTTTRFDVAAEDRSRARTSSATEAGTDGDEQESDGASTERETEDQSADPEGGNREAAADRTTTRTGEEEGDRARSTGNAALRDAVADYDESTSAHGARVASRADANRGDEGMTSAQAVRQEEGGGEGPQGRASRRPHVVHAQGKGRSWRVRAQKGAAAGTTQRGTGGDGEAEGVEEQERGAAVSGEASGTAAVQREAHGEEQAEARDEGGGGTQAGRAATVDAQTAEESEEEGMATSSFQKAGIPGKTDGNEAEEEEDEEDYKLHGSSDVRKRSSKKSQQESHTAEDEANNIDD